MAVATLLMLAIVGSACSNNDKGGGSGTFEGVPLTGAGATFPDPIYEQWFHDFRSVEPGAKINYQAIGSGGGVEQFTARTVDFGASDAPLQSDEISALPTQAAEIPTVLGGVVVAYNATGLKTGLKLDGKTTADIFLGTVTRWNDPGIAAQNPGVTLPSMPIAVVHRSDESGTTFVFTSWLASQSPEWQQKVGADKAVQWPTGIGGDGNDGVAAGISQTSGAVGYLSYDFAVTSNLGTAQIMRDDGTYVAPSIESISKAGGILTFPISPQTNILNSAAPGAYPIASTTYLLIYENQTDPDKGQTLVDLAYWALTKGQDMVQQLNYSPLPEKIRRQALDLLSKVQHQGSTIQPSPAVKG
jgi:phosphate transport system substrate-binding protein